MSLPEDQWEEWEAALAVRVVRQVKSYKELLCDQVHLLMAGRFGGQDKLVHPHNNILDILKKLMARD